MALKGTFGGLCQICLVPLPICNHFGRQVSVSSSSMSLLFTSLGHTLPKPKYTGEFEELPSHVQSKGPRVLGVGSLEENQVIIKVSYIKLTERRACSHIHSTEDLLRMEHAQDGGQGRPKILVTVEPSQKFLLLSIPWIWAGNHPPPRMLWLFK